MLAAFRNMATGFIAKIIIALLIISFGVWGIGDIFRGPSDKIVAVVDGDGISQQELDGLIGLLQQNYTQITAEIASDPSFQIEVLNNLINDRLLRKEADRLGLTFSRNTLARITGKNPLFQKEDGSFDRNRFLLTLRQNNHTEASYLGKLADEVSGQLIQDTLQLGVHPSEAMLTVYNKVRNEQREADLIILNEQSLAPIDAPSNEQLEKLYHETSDRYMEPELRSFKTVSFDSDTIWKAMKLDASDEELKALYDERKEAFTSPEKRQVSQWLFKSKEDALAVGEYSKSAKNYTDLGLVAQGELPDSAADTVFELSVGNVSEPIETAFGWHIFKVSKIQKPKTKSFDEMKDRLAEDYRAEQSDSEINRIANALEDALAAGSTLEEALKEVGLTGLKVNTLGPISATNINSKGKTVTLSPLEQQMVDLGFTLEEGETSALSLSDENSYYMVQLTELKPEALKPFDAVKSEVRAIYLSRARTKALKEMAETTAKNLQEAENLSAAIHDAGLKVYSSGKLKRTHDTVTNNSRLKNKILTSGFVTELFRLKPGNVTSAYPLPSGEYAIGILRKIYPATDSETGLVELKKEFEATLPDEITQHYIAYLRNSYDVEIKFDTLFGEGGLGGALQQSIVQ